MAGVWRIRGADGRDEVGEGVRICWALGSWYSLGFILRIIENHWKSVSKGILEATLYLQKTVLTSVAHKLWRGKSGSSSQAVETR